MLAKLDELILRAGIADWQDGAAVATIVGIAIGLLGLFLAGRQLRVQSRLARSEFEDSFTREYRQVASEIPTKVFLGALLTAQERAASFKFIYRYIDLCNEQKYLHERGRIGNQTWDEWEDGIVGNLARPELRSAWSYIAHYATRQNPDGTLEREFACLRALIEPEEYDPSRPYLPAPETVV